MLIREHMDQETVVIDFREEVSAAPPNITGSVRQTSCSFYALIVGGEADLGTGPGLLFSFSFKFDAQCAI